MQAPATSAPPAAMSPAAIAFNRFGIGARPHDELAGDPKRWLTSQFDRFEARPAGFAALADAGGIVTRYRQQQQAARRALGPTPAPDAKAQLMAGRKDFREDVQALYRAGIQARADAALATEAPFIERLVHFWSNHFCVSADNPQVTAFAPAFERDAIRPHVLGRFSDMLLAVERHPAMLIYLNQIHSIGPDSPAASRDRDHKRGLNENLAREIMELHTLGVRSGYTQADVTEFARALTGWTVEGLGGGATDQADPNRFIFREALHQPGARVIRGKRYESTGEAQARTVLLDFADAPATATHIATKLVRHFAGDDPPAAMTARVTASFNGSGGDLPTVYRTLIDSPEAWLARPVKFKTPWEWTISALRATGRDAVGQMQVAALQSQLGQQVWRPGSPAGWDDIAASWVGSDALLRRVEVAQRLSVPLGASIDARMLAPRIMPGSLSSLTSEQIARCESPAGALALMLVSPDFLRR